MPFLIETDVPLALISPRDKHHTEAARLHDKLAGEIQLSPFSPMELDLLIKSGKIIVTDAVAFYNALAQLLSERMSL